MSQLTVVAPDGARYPRRAVLSTRSSALHLAELVEGVALDEAYLDITARTRHGTSTADEVARRIKFQIHTEIGLTASVGAATSKLVAKVASGTRNRTVSCLYLPAPRPTSWRPSRQRDPGPGAEDGGKAASDGPPNGGRPRRVTKPASGPGAGHQRRGAAASRPRPRPPAGRRDRPAKTISARPRSTRTSATAASWRMRCAISPTGSQRG